MHLKRQIVGERKRETQSDGGKWREKNERKYRIEKKKEREGERERQTERVRNRERKREKEKRSGIKAR